MKFNMEAKKVQLLGGVQKSAKVIWAKHDGIWKHPAPRLYTLSGLFQNHDRPNTLKDLGHKTLKPQKTLSPKFFTDLNHKRPKRGKPKHETYAESSRMPIPRVGSCRNDGEVEGLGFIECSR